MTRATAIFLMLVILLVASFLRAHDMALMLDMTHYDEAYYGVDALSLLTQPRLTPFFPDNFGREGLFMYALTPMLAVFGGGALALRLTAFSISVLTVAATYRLGRELLGRGGGVWAAAVLAVLFWAVLAGHQAFRAHLYPLVGALAFAALFHARRRGGRGAWLLAGVLFGALAYTYIAARAWLAVAALVHVAWFVQTPRLRRHILLSATTALLTAALLIFYVITHPQAADQRSEQVAISSLMQLGENIIAWAGAWLWRGSSDVAYNLPQRPILDAPLVVLAGLAAMGWVVQGRGTKRGRAEARPYESLLFIAILFAASLAPALLTTDALKPLRAVGVLVPLALSLGGGVDRLMRWWSGRTRHVTGTRHAASLQRVRLPVRTRRAASVFIISVTVMILLSLSALITLRDFGTWVRSDDLYLPMEQHLNRAIGALANDVSAAPVYFSPFTPSHPVIRLRAGDLAPRPVSAFTSSECLRLPNSAEADYFALTLFDDGLEARLTPYAAVSLLYREAGDTPRYAVYRAQPDATLFTQPDDAQFAGRLGARVLAQTDDEQTVALTLALRALVPLDRAYTLFAHVYGDPTPYEGGVLWAQADMPLCLSSPPQTWRNDERIIQTATLTLPADLPTGGYDVAIGIYETQSLLRLPLTAGRGGENYALVGGLVRDGS
jgi:4-amino-4-deoxy-L-arabinose transferase-like glycosyltransferase